MAAKNVILALLALCSFAYGQTRALFVTTNGTVQWGTTLRFDGPLDFTTNGFAATTRSNLLLGLPALTNTSNAGLMSDLGGLTTNGSAAGLTNFPASLLRTNGDAAGLTNFPASLLRTNGDGGGLTNLPNANLSNAIGVLPLANGGTGATNASNARTALELGTAATNDVTAFQPANTNLTALAGGDGSSLTNVTITDASTLTNFPAELLRTNGSAAGLTNFPPAVVLTNGNAGGLTNFPAELLRTNGDGSGLTGVATYPALSNNAGKVLSVTTNEAGVEWLPVSNTVTDASLLTNFPASLLITNGNAAGLTNFPAELLRTNGSAAGLTSFPTLNQNTTGTASNVTGVVAIANGGTGASDASNARVNLLPSYTGNELRVLALNSNATDVVWAIDGGGTANLTNVTGVLAISNGGTGTNSASAALVNLGLWTSTSANHGVTIGSLSSVTGSSIAIGYDADAIAGSASIAIGATAKTRTNASGAIAIGFDATVRTNSIYGIAIGSNTSISNNTTNAIAIGYTASAGANNSAQIGDGDNTESATIQFLSAGTIDTNEWARLAALSTYPTTNISVVGTNNTNTLIFSNGILVEVQ